MNIVEAYKKARVGQTIRHMAHYKVDYRLSFTKTDNAKCLINHLHLLDDDSYLTMGGVADDWEVVKTQHKEEMTMRELRNRNGIVCCEGHNRLVSTHIPNNAKVVITWTEE